ncbi:MAG: N-carbamoyl-D-amino-acid hydrolase [Actinomycetota bacterium]
MNDSPIDHDAASGGAHEPPAARSLVVSAGQLGPIHRNERRESVVNRLIRLLERAHSEGAELIAFPELALTTFFPRWYVEGNPELDLDSFYETEMPGPETKRLFERAAELEVGFCLGYAELTPDGRRFNTQILVERDGSVVGKYHKVHLPGHREHEPWREFQHLERRYFEPGESFDTWNAFGGVVGMATCNDRRWPETYRVLALKGAELILIGYNTPKHYAPDPSQNPLQGFHHRLVMQAGAYQNGCYVIGTGKGGLEEGVPSLAESCIIAPSGQIILDCRTEADEVITAEIDLSLTSKYKETLFDFERYRRPEVYGPITAQKGAIPPATEGSDG